MFMYYWIYGHMDKQEMAIIELEMETGNWKLKTEIKAQLLHCCSPRMLLAPRHPSDRSPRLQFVISCFASLPLFPGLRHPQL